MATKARNITFTWRLSPKQRELFEAEARFKVAMAGRRFGKNEVETAAEIDYCLNPDEYRFGCDNPEDVLVWHIAPTYRQAYRHGYQKVLEKLPDALIEDNKGSERTPSRINLVTGPQLEFLSYGNPEGLQGEGVDLICGDEWAYSPSDVWDADLRPMLLDSGGGAIFISKPIGENHFLKKYQRGATTGMPYTDGKTREKDWYSVHATSYDNPLIPDTEIDSVKETTPEGVFRQEYLADPQAGGTLLTLDMLDYAPASVLEADHTWKWHVAVDIGIETNKQKARENDTDFWACAIVAEHPFHAEAYLLQVVRKRGQTPAQASQWLRHVMSQVPTDTIYYEAVQAQKWLESELKGVGLQPIPVDHTRPKEERITFLSVPFDNDNVKLIDWEDTPNQYDWSDFRTEWAGFPADHDDQLDAVEMALRQVNFGRDISMLGGDMYGDGESEDEPDTWQGMWER